MRSIKAAVLALALGFNQTGLAECDLGEDIQKVTHEGQEGFFYPNDCHRLVGKTFMDKKDLEEEVLSYKELVEAQRDQLGLYKERYKLWKNTAFEMEAGFAKYESLSETNKWIHFGAGIAVMLAASWAAGQTQ